MAPLYFTCILILLYESIIVNADYVATLSGCPSEYQRIANGCYYIVNSTSYSQTAAYSMCANTYTATSPTITHLLAMESQAESIALSIWFQGFGYTVSFWTDGTTNSDNVRVWSWSGQNYENFGYIKDQLTNKKYMYLKFNGTYYEFYDDNGGLNMGFICEAQVPCYESDNVCQNNGSCWVNNGRVLCTCIPGFEGSLCEILVDNCDSVPCMHGGTCINQVNSYTCNCTEFYTGPNCETAVSYQYANAITAALALSITIVGILLATLSIMDLPWEDLIRVWRKRFKQAKSVSDTTPQVDQAEEEDRMPSKAQLLASEQEMLRRFRSALEQAKSSTPRSRIY